MPTRLQRISLPLQQQLKLRHVLQPQAVGDDVLPLPVLRERAIDLKDSSAYPIIYKSEDMVKYLQKLFIEINRVVTITSNITNLPY